jgi:NADPH:quinone reductase-like Zn-dependent oxidoreductase
VAFGEIAEPEIADSEVLVRVHAAGIDRGTWHAITGLPYLGRLYSGLRKPKRPVPGLDLAGTVAAIGADVTRFAVGDEVFGIGKGSYLKGSNLLGATEPSADAADQGAVALVG